MRMNKTTSYAIRIISRMAQDEGILSTVELVKLEGISRGILMKILDILKQEQIVISYRGITGGYTLTKKGRMITVYEVIKIIQGDMLLYPEMEKELYECRNRKLYKELKKINEEYISRLSNLQVG